MSDKIYRSDDDIIVAGVFGGLGEYFQINSSIFRIAFIILAVLSGQLALFVALYGLAFLMIPKRESSNYTYTNYKGPGSSQGYSQGPYGNFGNFGSKFSSIKNDALSSEKVRKIAGYSFLGLGIVLLINKLILDYLNNQIIMAATFIILGL